MLPPAPIKSFLFALPASRNSGPRFPRLAPPAILFLAFEPSRLARERTSEKERTPRAENQILRGLPRVRLCAAESSVRPDPALRKPAPIPCNRRFAFRALQTSLPALAFNID